MSTGNGFRQAALVCAAATLLLAWPALGGAFLVNPNSDQYIAGFAFRDFAAQSLRTGHGVPLWNPYLFGGMPYVDAMHGDIFYPTMLLRWLLPTDIAMTWGFILHTMLAGLFTFGFLRSVGVRPPAATIGGLAYQLSGIVVSYPSAGHDGKLFVSALLPAALWALTLGLRDRRSGAWGALALVVGLSVLSPHPQLLQYMLLLAGCFALWLTLRPLSVPSSVPSSVQRAVDVPIGAERPPASWRPLTSALAAVGLGLTIGAIQFLPVMEYVGWSPRAAGKPYEYATSFSFPLEETIDTYLPEFSGLLERYWGRNDIHFHSEYLGASVLVLALLALGGGLGNRHRGHALFWVGVVVVSLLWAWGGHTPFYQLVYAVVPGSRFFRAPGTMFVVTAFAIAVLASFGAERVLAGRFTPRYLVGWGAFALVVAAIASAGGLTDLAYTIGGSTRADAIAANAPEVVLGAWRSAFVVLAMLAAMEVLRRGKVSAALCGWLLAGVVTLDLWSVGRHYWRFSPRADRLYAEDDIIRYLTSRPEPGRVIALPLGDDLAPHDPFLTGNALMSHGIRSVLGYHGNEIGRYQELYAKDDGYSSIANPNFWALTNARYFYTNAPGLPFPGAHLVAGPVANAAGTMTYLYELPGEHPLAWVAPVRVKLDEPAARSTVLNPLFDVYRVAIFDSGAVMETAPVNSPLPPPVPFGVRISNYAPGAIDLELQGPAPAGSALIVSENYYPGWTASVDGHPATVSRADYTLIGVELPTGARRVRLRFTSATYDAGKLLTVLSLGAALLWWGVGYAADRRQLAA